MRPSLNTRTVVKESISDVFVRHRGPVTCAAPVPNSSKIVSSAYDGAVGLFDSVTGQVDLLGYHAHLVNRVAVNPAGTLAASCSSDFNIYIWDLNRAQHIKTLRGHADDVEDFVFIDDDYAASVSRDWRVLLWNLNSGSIEHVFLGHTQDVLSISFLDGKLYTSGDDMCLRIWDISTRKLIETLGPFATEADTCAIDPIHRRVVLGCDDGLIRIFDIDSGALTCSIPAHQAGIKKVACSPRNGDILSAAYDQRILVWDALTLKLKRQLQQRATTWERSFNWSSDGHAICAGTFDGTILKWSADSGDCECELGLESAQDSVLSTPGNACFNDIALLPNNVIAVVSDDGIVRTGKLSEHEANWQYVHTPESGRVLANAVTTSFDQVTTAIITGTHDQTLQRFELNLAGIQQSLAIKLAHGPINCIRVAQHTAYHGQYFVACYSGAILRVGDDGRILDTIYAHENAVKELALHPSEPLGVSCSADGVLASWTFDGTVQQTYPGHQAIIDTVDISPDGALIASAGRDFTLKVHRLNDAALIHTIGLGRRSPKALCFVSNDIVIVSNYWGELLRVNLNDGSVFVRKIAENGISAIACRGECLLVTSYDGAVYLVRTKDLVTLNSLRSMTQRINSPAFVV